MFWLFDFLIWSVNFCNENELVLAFKVSSIWICNWYWGKLNYSNHEVLPGLALNEYTKWCLIEVGADFQILHSKKIWNKQILSRFNSNIDSSIISSFIIKQESFWIQAFCCYLVFCNNKKFHILITQFRRQIH